MLRALTLGLAGLLLLMGCSDDQQTSAASSPEGDTDPVEVEVGEAFTWNGFAVDDGWELAQADMLRGEEQGTMPVLTGTVTNEGESARFVLMQVTFARGDAPVATVPCTSEKLDPGAATEVECRGMGSSYPEEYDTVTVAEIRR